MGGGKTFVPKKYQPARPQRPQNKPTPSTSSRNQTTTSTAHSNLTIPINWPAEEVKFLTSPRYSRYVKPSQLDIIRKPPPPPAAAPVPSAAEAQPGENDTIPLDFPIGPNASVQIQRITDPNHPAYGQCGLFAARDLLPGELILPYFGVVHAGAGLDSDSETGASKAGEVKGSDLSKLDGDLKGLSLSPSEKGAEETAEKDTEVSKPKSEKEHEEDMDTGRERELERIQHEKSDYDLWLSREADLAVDGETMGNEARFINDYRGVPGKERENAELKLVWDERIVHRDSSGGIITGADQEEDASGSGRIPVKRGEWTMAVYVLPLSKKARLKVQQAQAQAEEYQRKKLAQAQKKNAASGGKKASSSAGGNVVATPVTKASSVGVIRKGEEILVSYGRGFWEKRKEAGV